MKNYRSVLYIAGGACSYGILATIVKYANKQGVETPALTFLQFLLGFVFLVIVNIFSRGRSQQKGVLLNSKVRLTTWGISLGLTTTLYYLSLRYIPVSIAIILLMQSIWINLVFETLITKQRPTIKKISGVLIVMVGTLLATNVFNSKVSLDYRGLLLGFGAGVSYAISIFSSSKVETHLPAIIRSKYLVLGGLLIIVVFWNQHILAGINAGSLFWGVIIAIFGTILPPLLFTKGIPNVGIAMGSIIASLEIPVSIISAVLILHEQVLFIQWMGVVVICLAVVVINLKK